VAGKGGNWFYLVGGEVLGGVTNQSEVSAGALPLRNGVNFDLELQADRMLADARKGTTRHADIKEQGYFSAMQLYNRRRKEFCVGLSPDPSIISGQASRVYVPDSDGGPRDLSYEHEDFEEQHEDGAVLTIDIEDEDE
jgi:hypothetical protein